MKNTDEFKSIRFKAFEFENRDPDAPYNRQLVRYKAAVIASKDQADARAELTQASLDLNRAFRAWQEEP
jgi:hypothetical protein